MIKQTVQQMIFSRKHKISYSSFYTGSGDSGRIPSFLGCYDNGLDPGWGVQFSACFTAVCKQHVHSSLSKLCTG